MEGGVWRLSTEWMVEYLAYILRDRWLHLPENLLSCLFVKTLRTTLCSFTWPSRIGFYTIRLLLWWVPVVSWVELSQSARCDTAAVVSVCDTDLLIMRTSAAVIFCLFCWNDGDKQLRLLESQDSPQHFHNAGSWNKRSGWRQPLHDQKANKKWKERPVSHHKFSSRPGGKLLTKNSNYRVFPQCLDSLDSTAFLDFLSWEFGCQKSRNETELLPRTESLSVTKDIGLAKENPSKTQSWGRQHKVAFY